MHARVLLEPHPFFN